MQEREVKIRLGFAFLSLGTVQEFNVANGLTQKISLGGLSGWTLYEVVEVSLKREMRSGGSETDPLRVERGTCRTKDCIWINSREQDQLENDILACDSKWDSSPCAVDTAENSPEGTALGLCLSLL
ncbi:hypothetical protein R1flu_024398 [Riccia fluitans]|uniref:Uncharacterized protein n=1 Tax=Riccia fluitans TaxID=41844 RepID=A0ABD1XXP8_9MARC